MDTRSETLADQVRFLMKDRLLVEVEDTGDDLLSTGALDSLALVQLLVNIEEQFGVVIPLAELEIDDIRSIDSIVNLISARRYSQVSGS